MAAPATSTLDEIHPKADQQGIAGTMSPKSSRPIGSTLHSIASVSPPNGVNSGTGDMELQLPLSLQSQPVPTVSDTPLGLETLP